MKPIWVLWGLGLCMYLATAYNNIGIIALDDYEYGVARVIPAQNQNNADIIADVGIRSPVPSLFLVSLSRVALKLGMVEPVYQFRFVLTILGILSYCLLSLFAWKHFRLRDRCENFKEPISIFLIGFYFLCPLFFTRPLIESLSAPALLMSAYFTCEYWVREKRRSLVFAIFTLMVASMFRFQAGVCFFAILTTFCFVKPRRDFAVLIGCALAAFLISGFTDLWLRGEFHGSLRAYVTYNLSYSSTYGVTPFYTFSLLFLGLSLPPLFFLRYRNLNWKEEYTPLFPTLLFFLFFVIAHSAVPHKEERFMVPMLPLFLVLLTPLASYLFSFHKTRVAYFLTLNLVLLVLASFNIPQNNTISLAIYLSKRPAILRVVGVEDTLVLFPKAFALHVPKDESITFEQFSKRRVNLCEDAVAIRTSLKDKIPTLEQDFKKIAEFKPGFLEDLVVKLNPKQNARRGKIELYVPHGCKS